MLFKSSGKSRLTSLNCRLNYKDVMKHKIKRYGNIVEIFSIPEELKEVKLPLFLTKIQTGFPSPAEDYIDQKLDLNEYAIKHPSATFFCKGKRRKYDQLRYISQLFAS